MLLYILESLIINTKTATNFDQLENILWKCFLQLDNYLLSIYHYIWSKKVTIDESVGILAHRATQFWKTTKWVRFVPSVNGSYQRFTNTNNFS